MDKLEEMLTQAESQEESNEQWEHLDRYETKEYYTDEHGYTRINNKNIEDLSENISVSGEENSQYIEFRMNRFYDGVDLSEMTISVFYEAEGVGDEGYVINAYRNSEELKFGWVIPASVTQYHEIQLCVWVRGVLEDGSDYILKTLPKVYTIYPGLNIGGTIPEPEENWYLNFVRVMDSKVFEASSYASVAKSSAEEAKSLEDSYKEMNKNVNAKSSQVDEQYSHIQIMYSESLEAAASAKSSADRAEAISGVSIATKEIAGLVKGGKTAVSEDGELLFTKTTKARTLLKSHAGGLKINSIEGESQQDGTPSPDAEAKIKSVKVGAIKGVGKNLCYNSATYDGWEAMNTNFNTVVTNEVYKGGKVLKYTIAWRYVQPPFRKFKAGTYTISFDAKTDTAARSSIWINGISDGKAVSVGGTSWERYSTTFTLDRDSNRQIALVIPTGQTIYSEIYIANIQIEEGSVATDYEPYCEKSIQLSTPITLRGIGDVKDKVNNENGSVYREWHEFTLRASHIKSVTDGGGSTQMFVVTLPYNNVESSTSKLQILCSHYTFCDWNSNPWFVDNSISYYQYNTIRIKDSNYATIDEFKAFVESKYESGNPIMIMYRIATTAEPLPLADQIALHQLESFDTVTYISTDSTIEPVIEVEYGTSVVGAYAIKGMNTAEANALQIAQLNTLTNELATQLV